MLCSRLGHFLSTGKLRFAVAASPDALRLQQGCLQGRLTRAFEFTIRQGGECAHAIYLRSNIEVNTLRMKRHCVHLACTSDVKSSEIVASLHGDPGQQDVE